MSLAQLIQPSKGNDVDSGSSTIIELVKTALREDIGKGDLTSLACLEPDPAKARIVAKADGVLSGLKPAHLTFQMIDSANNITFLKKDGESFNPGDIIAEIDGFNQTMLTSERVALNFLGHLSGVATHTAKFVDAIKRAGSKAAIRDTRKTTPGWRTLEKEAVVHGGGENHRHGLYDMILIKENHICSAGSIKKAVARAREYLNSSDFRIQFKSQADDILIEVEITNELELREALASSVDILLLDNQTPESLKTLVTLSREIDSSVKLEASGNITLNNVASVATTGVDYISVGAITHSSVVTDFSMLFDKA